jgi:hypothetical protein
MVPDDEAAPRPDRRSLCDRPGRLWDRSARRPALCRNYRLQHPLPDLIYWNGDF